MTSVMLGRTSRGWLALTMALGAARVILLRCGSTCTIDAAWQHVSNEIQDALHGMSHLMAVASSNGIEAERANAASFGR